MRPLLCCALFMLLPVASVAAQKPATQTNSDATLPANVSHQAEAYADYTLGHISQVQFEDSGNQDDAANAIDYYKKAQALDPDSIQIPLQMANTYAESDQLGSAVSTAKEILKKHPDNVAAHRLLARIYVRTLGELGPDANQGQTLSEAVQQYEQVLKLDPTDSEAGLWLARLYSFQNQPDKAQTVLEQLLKHDPSNQEVIAQYSQLLLDEGHANQAISLLSKSASQANSAPLYDLLGDAYSQIHDSAHAEAAYRQAVQLAPNDPTVLGRLASTLFNENKYDEAIPPYEQLTKIDPSNATNFLRLAEMYFQQKKYDLAHTNIMQAAQRDPHRLEVIYNQALIDEAMNHLSDAVNVLSGAIARLKQQPAAAGSNPAIYGALYQALGTVYRRQANYDAAVHTFQQMIPLGTSQAQRGRIELIQTYRENHQIDKAIATAHQAMQADPKSRNLKIEYAYLLGEKNQTAAAVKMLRSMLDGSDADRETYISIAQVDLSGRKFADAERAAKTAESMTKDPQQKSAAWAMLGQIYLQQKKFGPAEKQFKKVLAVDPKNAEALNDYGYMLAEEGVRLNEASDMVQQALAVDGSNYAFLDSMGWVYFKQKRLTDARQYLLKAIAIRPNDPTVLGHLGDVYQGLGQTNLALATWQKALDQWRLVAPADYEPNQVHAIERKVSEAKNTLRKNHADTAVPH